MSDMIERVAAAIAVYGIRNHIVKLPKEDAVDLARAAIEAMREPTEAMLKAAWSVDRYAQAGEEWDAMIEAALGKVDA